jgi:hypothetical protein
MKRYKFTSQTTNFDAAGKKTHKKLILWPT